MENKFAAALCAEVTSPCPIHDFFIKPAQFGEP